MLITGNKIFIEELETYEFLKKKNIYDFWSRKNLHGTMEICIILDFSFQESMPSFKSFLQLKVMAVWIYK